MQVKCEKCGHKWNYDGDYRTAYTRCSRCTAQVCLIDNSQCEECGSKKNIDVHHIDEDHGMKGSSTPEKLKALCRQCHKEKHRDGEGINLTCQNCSHNWSYRGNNPNYATCPRCKSSVKIPDPEK